MGRKLQILDNLIYVNRYSGNPIIRKESVSDHVWCMNSLAFEFVPILNNKFSTKFKLETVIYGISLHDLDESLYCDIPRNFKYHNPTIRSAITTTVDQLLKDTLSTKLVQDIHYFEDRTNVYGFLIKVLDIAQAGLKMIDEINLGNSYFIGEIDNAYDSLYGMQAKLSSLDINMKYKEGLDWLCTNFCQYFDELLNKNKNE